MKKQLLKRLFAFIILIFSVSFLNAQCGGNKVRLFKSTHGGACISKCVAPDEVRMYFNMGWRYFCVYHPYAKNSGKALKTKSSGTLSRQAR